MATGLGYVASRAGCRPVAVGVETEVEAATVLGLGIALAQVHLFGVPAP